MGLTVAYVVSSYALIQADLARIRSIGDAHLSFRTAAFGGRLLKLLEFAKVRGVEFGAGNIVSFDVEPTTGMKMTPLSKVSVQPVIPGLIRACRGCRKVL